MYEYCFFFKTDACYECETESDPTLSDSSASEKDYEAEDELKEKNW